MSLIITCHYEFIFQMYGCKNIQIFVKCLSNYKKVP